VTETDHAVAGLYRPPGPPASATHPLPTHVRALRHFLALWPYLAPDRATKPGSGVTADISERGAGPDQG